MAIAEDRGVTELEIEILSKRDPAKVIPESPHDPDNERLGS